MVTRVLVPASTVSQGSLVTGTGTYSSSMNHLVTTNGTLGSSTDRYRGDKVQDKSGFPG